LFETAALLREFGIEGWQREPGEGA
jgi:hypothetical protein